MLPKLRSANGKNQKLNCLARDLATFCKTFLYFCGVYIFFSMEIFFFIEVLSLK
jgi:hypothetical protein